jgi:AraC family transcriptional regulator, arabinose operon regulatory protein
MQDDKKAGSHKNIWQGRGRQRIEIPKPLLKSKVQQNPLLNHLYVCSLGYYPNAENHYTYRKKGLPENFLFYCVDGRGWYSIADKKYEIGPNEFFMLPQNMEHAYGSNAINPWTIYWVHFGGNALPVLNKLPAVEEHFRPAYIKTTDEIFTVFGRMYKTLEAGYSLDNLLFAGLSLSYFLNLFLYPQKHQPVKAAQPDEHIVESAIRYMQEKIKDNITLGEISKKHNYSPSRFSNLFKQKTGYSPIDYFIQLKMQKASQQLDFTNDAIKKIAANLGFDDPYYFSKRFTKVIGMSPTKYRLVKKD